MNSKQEDFILEQDREKSKLKTLKDIDGYTLTCLKCKQEGNMINEGDLKSEAIKWVKEFMQYPLAEIGHDWKNIKVMRIADFMHFFNLTEEDLK